jgi:hypothetical protein
MPLVPQLLAEPVWQSLDPGKRAAYDEDRVEHHSRLLVVQTPAVRAVITQGRRLAHLNKTAHYGRCGLIVSGPARTGKTTAITQLGKTIEVIHQRRHPRSGGDIPVIYITVPPAATAKMIAIEFARFLGLPASRQANITGVIESVCGVCLDTGVTMVLVDELHNLNTATRAGAEASDTLKYFSERIPATFIYSGISLERSGLLAGTRGEQIAGRFGIIRTSAFAPGAQWQALIAALEDSLRLHRHRPGTLTRLDGYLHQRTRGMIGSLLWLIRSAAIAAVIDGTEKITRKSLDQVEADLASQAPRGRNQRASDGADHSADRLLPTAPGRRPAPAPRRIAGRAIRPRLRQHPPGSQRDPAPAQPADTLPALRERLPAAHRLDRAAGTRRPAAARPRLPARRRTARLLPLPRGRRQPPPSW